MKARFFALKSFLYVFPLRPPFFGVLSAWSVLKLAEGSGQRAVNGIVFSMLSLLLELFAVTVFVVLLLSYLAYLYSAREYSRFGDATFLCVEDATVDGDTAMIDVALPAKRRSDVVNVRIGFQLNGDRLTPPVTLHRSRRSELILDSYSESVPEVMLGARVPVPGLKIGEYAIPRSFIFFEDFMGLFRFCYSEKENGVRFFVLGAKSSEKDIQLKPEAAVVEKNIRDKTRMEGELLNMKKYVPGSDSPRRIVWRIVARRQVYVTRNPETENPNSSRLPVFATFRALQAERFPPGLADALENSFKGAILGTLERIGEGAVDVDYFPENAAAELLRGRTNAVETLAASLASVPPDRRIETAVVSQAWQPDLTLADQVGAFSDYLAGFRNFPSSMILFANSLDSSWIDFFRMKRPSRGPATVFYKALSGDFHRGRRISLLGSLFFLPDEREPWTLDSRASRIRYWGIRRSLVENERAARESAVSAGYRLIEV
ncbi:MAG: DUF58 domain-containing protein [Spirochaetes bacterium]|nr:DUF58 domain-containing protein [Spirochaetota bacterium]